MTVDLSKVARYPDGALKAVSIQIDGCDSCDSIHIDFKDENGVVFASAAMPDAMAMDMAAKLIEIREYMEKRRGRKVVRQ